MELGPTGTGSPEVAPKSPVNLLESQRAPRVDSGPKLAPAGRGPAWESSANVVCFEPVSGQLTDARRRQQLRPRTAALLDYLLRNTGRLVSKDELLRGVWRDAIVTEDSLVQCVKEIRKALGASRRDLIRTLPRQGYAFVGRARLEEAPAEAAEQLADRRQQWVLSPASSGGPPGAGASNDPAAPARAHPKPWLCGALAVALLAAGTAWWSRLHPAAGHVAPPLSIVVLPFQPIDEDPKRMAFFAAGLSDDLTNEISRIPHAVVVAHGTAETFEGVTGDVRRVGRELGVRFALEGSVRREGDEIRLNVRLWDTQDGHQLWAERFSGDRRDLVALERDVTTTLIRHLQLGMLAADVERGLRQHASNPDAYDLALRGWALLLRKQPDANAEGRETALKALAIDPKSAFAWSVVSKSYFLDIGSRWMHLRGHSREEWLRRAEETALKAYTLEPEMFEAQGAYAGVLTLRGRLEEAVALRARQMSRNPSDPEPYHFSAYAHQLMGEPAKSIALEMEALRISPRDSWAFNFYGVIAASHLQLGQDKQALAAADLGIGLRPEAAILHALAAAAAANLGYRERAGEEIATFRRLQPDYTIEKFRADFPNATPAFLAQREHFYEGLRKAGLP